MSPANDVLSSSLYKRVKEDVERSLSGIVANSPDKFIVNPTVWYNIVPTKKGSLDAKPRVMNSADFLSRQLGANLKARGWIAGASEQEIDGQKIDGYIELESSDSMSSMGEGDIIDFLYEAKKARALGEMTARQAFDFYYSRFCANSWLVPTEVPDSLKRFFKATSARPIRIGLEFETGNIASSFRALMKLEHLFRKGLLDYGVFITSIDKASTAAQIWPISNRNGSFSELANRRATAGLTIPLLQIGFEPDGLSKSAGYLGSNGRTFKPKPTGKRKRVDGQIFLEYKYNGSSCWRPED